MWLSTWFVKPRAKHGLVTRRARSESSRLSVSPLRLSHRRSRACRRVPRAKELLCSSPPSLTGVRSSTDEAGTEPAVRSLEMAGWALHDRRSRTDALCRDRQQCLIEVSTTCTVHAYQRVQPTAKQRWYPDARKRGRRGSGAQSAQRRMGERARGRDGSPRWRGSVCSVRPW